MLNRARIAGNTVVDAEGIVWERPSDPLKDGGAEPVFEPIQAPDAPDSGSTAQPAAPATIGIGQTVAQVMAAIGPPVTIVKLGAKEIYVYKDLKITFLNGKVSEVQ